MQHLPCPRMGNIRPLDAFLTQGLAPVCSCPIILRCPHETKPGYLPFLFTSISESKQEAGCKCLTRSPSIYCLKKCKQEACCKCLAWGPSISCLSLRKCWLPACVQLTLIPDFVHQRAICGVPWASLVAQTVKHLPAMLETGVRSLGQEDPWRSIHSSILAWRIPLTEEPGGLQSTGSQRVGHD